MSDLADVLHAAGVPGFVYVPGVHPPHATIKGGYAQSMHGVEHWWASCRPCWWWDEDDGAAFARTPAEAQARADAHNALHHKDLGLVDTGPCAWCEEAQSPTYLAHEGHDKECPLQ